MCVMSGSTQGPKFVLKNTSQALAIFVSSKISKITCWIKDPLRYGESVLTFWWGAWAGDPSRFIAKTAHVQAHWQREYVLASWSFPLILSWSFGGASKIRFWKFTVYYYIHKNVWPSQKSGFSKQATDYQECGLLGFLAKLQTKLMLIE